MFKGKAGLALKALGGQSLSQNFGPFRANMLSTNLGRSSESVCYCGWHYASSLFPCSRIAKLTMDELTREKLV